MQRMITNNAKLFENSKEALTNQYNKRVVMMRDQNTELEVKKNKTKQELDAQY